MLQPHKLFSIFDEKLTFLVRESEVNIELSGAKIDIKVTKYDIYQVFINNLNFISLLQNSENSENQENFKTEKMTKKSKKSNQNTSKRLASIQSPFGRTYNSHQSPFAKRNPFTTKKTKKATKAQRILF